MPSPLFEIIRNAIRNRQQVIATYDNLRRELCPHALGYKDGTERALFFQFGGMSSKGPITQDGRNNWRCLFLSALSDVVVQDGEWHTWENHSQQSTCIDVIVEQVDF